MPSGHCSEPDAVRAVVAWIRENLELRQSDSAEALYDRMESQSGCQLPLIYLPFDPRNRGHFADRAQILDYAITCGPGRVLDFGPGDGWPSLLIAPLVEEVVGVDGSRRRVEVCTENARRLKIENATFVHVPPSQPLPFEAGSFDAVTAAASIEQTPDPKATLRELHRVLKPGGRLRMHYESLGCYRGRREQEMFLGESGSRGDLTVYDRDLGDERVEHFLIAFDFTRAEIEEVTTSASGEGLVTPAALEQIRGHITDAATWSTQHPSCQTWLRWLSEVGFSDEQATHDGGSFAKRLFGRLPLSQRPATVGETDGLLRPLVEVVVTMDAVPQAPGGEGEPWITARRDRGGGYPGEVQSRTQGSEKA